MKLFAIRANFLIFRICGRTYLVYDNTSFSKAIGDVLVCNGTKDFNFISTNNTLFRKF